MRIKSNNNKKVPIILIIVLIGALLTYLFITNITGKSSTNSQVTESANDINVIDFNEPTSEQKEAGRRAKEKTIQHTTPPANIAKPLQMTITTAKVDSGVLYIRGSIDGIYNTGSCTLTLEKNSTVITKESGVQPLPNESTCKGFDIPVSELPSGTWSTTLEVTIGEKYAEDRVDVTI